MKKTAAEIETIARQVLDIEAEAITRLKQETGDSFLKAVELMLACEGRVVVTGMGKSGHIANKIAATLASTGTPAFFVHPGEASHGDLGMITGKDLVLALSNSGETDELLTILPIIKRLHIPLVTMTGNPQSRLSQAADANLNVQVNKEACPLGLAPTASTTAALAMGDALAVALLECRDFTHEDFARSHPAGSLGRRLLLRVEDLMQTGDMLPMVSESTALTDALIVISSKGLGMTTIVDQAQEVIGIFTDGDLRRLLDHGEVNLHTLSMKDVMNTCFSSIHPEELAAEAIQIMESKRINALPVIDSENKLVGAIKMHELLRAGIV